MIPLSYNVRSLVVRKRTTLAAALGIALVVFVLAASMMLSAGIRRTLGRSGRADNAIVIRKGSDTELASSLDEPQVGLVLASPGVKKGPNGAPLGAGEVVMVVTMDKLGTDGVSNVQLRGVGDDVLAFRPEVRVIAGRPLQPGTNEVMIGRRLRGRFRGLELGQTIELRKNRPAQVVGVFEDGGSSFESEVWVDRDTLRAAFGREGLVSSVRARLESAAAFDSFAAAVGSDKQLGLEAMRESVYYEKQSEGTSIFVTALGVVISLFFALGAMIGAMITMYASIADRQREIGTLRALGFSRRSVLASFLFEAVALAGAGGAIGAVASLGLGFVKFSMINFQSWSEVVFSFDPTPGTIVGALIAAGVMGLIGGFFPAIRAARTSPIEAMRG